MRLTKTFIPLCFYGTFESGLTILRWRLMVESPHISIKVNKNQPYVLLMKRAGVVIKFAYG
ncbi:hypothetical protein CPI84_10770 [Erwinia pyrifoliae]|nr:hypothetical protein CPI84_10770 [Erwinia pyrifoliae]